MLIHCWLPRFFETLCFEQTNVLFKFLQIFTNFFQLCMSNVLPNLTKKLYESHLVGALFSRGFFGLFRIGKITLTFQTLLRKYWIFFSDTHIDLYRIQFFKYYISRFSNGTTITITKSPDSYVCF